MFKRLAIIVCTTIGAFASEKKPPRNIQIGIIQAVEHPALDRTREGIIDELKSLNVPISWESAQFNPSLATQIAQKYVGQEATLIVALGTLPAQAALAQTKSIPIVFSSVTDPKGAKLQGNNISGVSNFIEPKRHFKAMRERYPAAKRIGVIYNPGDVNSVSLIDIMKIEASKVGFELIEATASRSSDLISSTQSLLSKVDLIFINNDNTALSGFEGIARTAKAKSIPVFCSDIDVFPLGADGVLGPDQYELGRQTGRMIKRALESDKGIQDIPIEYAQKVETKYR